MNLLLVENEDFIGIYHKYVDTVYRICFLYFKNKSDTEDAVQTTFIKLMEYRGTFQNLEHVKAWLIVVATNHCKNQVRHWWRKNQDFSSIPESILQTEFKIDETLETIFKLPSQYKTVLYLYYYEGYNSKEIATMLQKKESTIRSHLYLGRNRLKYLIGGENE